MMSNISKRWYDTALFSHPQAGWLSALGARAALLANRVVMAAMFIGVSLQDPIAYAGAAAILLVAAILAVWCRRVVPQRWMRCFGPRWA